MGSFKNISIIFIFLIGLTKGNLKLSWRDPMKPNCRLCTINEKPSLAGNDNRITDIGVSHLIDCNTIFENEHFCSHCTRPGSSI